MREADKDPVAQIAKRHGVAGQLLRLLDFLIYQPVEAAVLCGGGVLVNVLEPAPTPSTG